MISIIEYQDALEYLENKTEGITTMNDYIKRVSRRLAKERNAKPTIRPKDQKEKTDWKWKDCYDEVLDRKDRRK